MTSLLVILPSVAYKRVHKRKNPPKMSHAVETKARYAREDDLILVSYAHCAMPSSPSSAINEQFRKIYE